MAKNSGRPKIKLVPVDSSGKGGGHFYTTDENKAKKLEIIKKYNPVRRKHEDYKRAKIS